MAIALLNNSHTNIKVTNNTGNINKNFNIMSAKNDNEIMYYEHISELQQKKGMDCLSETEFDMLLDYFLSNGKYRDALFMVCMANWGMRYSDISRVRYGYIFNADGYIKKSFTLPNGEKKTGKQNIYYNNEAIATALLLYLERNSNKRPYEFIFVGESGNVPKISLLESEITERFCMDKKKIDKKYRDIINQQKSLVELYSKGKIAIETFDSLNSSYEEKRAMLNLEKEKLDNIISNYKSEFSDAENIIIKKAMTRQGAGDILIDGLSAIGLNTINRTNKRKAITLDKKINTHSLRKTFSEGFVITGSDMSRNGELEVNPTIIKLLQDKLMHDKISTTNRYNQSEERAFNSICMGMNLGLSVLRKYIEVD